MADAIVFYEGPIVSRGEAKAAGLKFYFTGKPCVKGHIAQRYTSSSCVVCSEKQRTDWSAKNKEHHKQLQAQWYQENRERQDAKSAKWARSNTSRRTMHHTKWRAKNRDHVRAVKKQWRKSNPERVAIHEKQKNAKRRVMLKYVVSSRMRGRMYDALRRVSSSKEGKSWREFVPYSADDLIAHLKKTMPAGYCWSDVLNGRLHVDHIVPVSAFNFTSPEDIDFQKCWALKNLRLLPASENCSKGARLEKPFQPSFAGI